MKVGEPTFEILTQIEGIGVDVESPNFVIIVKAKPVAIDAIFLIELIGALIECVASMGGFKDELMGFWKRIGGDHCCPLLQIKGMSGVVFNIEVSFFVGVIKVELALHHQQITDIS